MKNLLRKTSAFIAAAMVAGGLMMPAAAEADTIKIALAETPSDELAAFFVALDRAKANGLDYEWTAFSDEELAIQAVLSGQMDIGFGTPYAAMQRSKAPIRIIFQLSKLKFFPVTTKKYSKLEDLDGEPILLALARRRHRLHRQRDRGPPRASNSASAPTCRARPTGWWRCSAARPMRRSSICRTRTS